MAARGLPEPGVSAQPEVDRDRIGRIPPDDLEAALNRVRRPADAREANMGKLDVDLRGLERLGRMNAKADEPKSSPYCSSSEFQL